VTIASGLDRRGTVSLRRSEDISVLTQPNHRFRVASLTKIFTIAAIERLIAMNRLQWSTQAFPFFGITTKLLADQTLDPNINNITVMHLVNHTSGIKHVKVTTGGSTRTFEPLDDLRAVTARLGKTTTPTRDDLVRYVDEVEIRLLLHLQSPNPRHRPRHADGRAEGVY
jgi:CubicO group peptidase (beta-lactamase class C family)